MQVYIELHLARWWLVPFTPTNKVPGTRKVTWLCVTISLMT